MIHRALLVDDEPTFLKLVFELLRSDPNLSVVGQAASGEEALELLPSLQPEVVIIDVNMPGMGGFETAGRLLDVSPATRLIIVSSVDDPGYARAAKSVGAVAFLKKNELTADALLAALHPE